MVGRWGSVWKVVRNKIKLKYHTKVFFLWTHFAIYLSLSNFWNDINWKQVGYAVKKIMKCLFLGIKEKKVVPRTLPLYIFYKCLMYLSNLFWGIYFKRSLGSFVFLFATCWII